jgi:hypothetical protein
VRKHGIGSTGGTLEESSGSKGWSTLDIKTLDNRKRKKPGQIDDDLKSDLKRYFGSSGEGAYLVDEREYLTDREGNRY